MEYDALGALVPLPGGATAVYTASGLAWYRHPDWLGSSRLASTPATRTMYYDGAYSPYGETIRCSPLVDQGDRSEATLAFRLRPRVIGKAREDLVGDGVPERSDAGATRERSSALQRPRSAPSALRLLGLAAQLDAMGAVPIWLRRLASIVDAQHIDLAQPQQETARAAVGAGQRQIAERWSWKPTA